MVLMALDHVRDYFHYGTSLGDPTNLETTTPFLFFTRFITHYCAPVFVFLAGTSAFLYGNKNGQKSLFKFLITRGIWLIALEVLLNNLIWQFDLGYHFIVLQVIWAIGFSMICLSFLTFLPRILLLCLGLIIVFGHNMLDGIVAEGDSTRSVIWYALHQVNVITLGDNHSLAFFYPVLPWIGVMILGFCLGSLYKSDVSSNTRRPWLLGIGLGALLLFFILRGINLYGDLVPWSNQKNTTFTILSFFNVTKYPPSLAYVLITIGPALLFLFAIESVKSKVTDFFLVFGRVPFFYYFLHVLTIHVFAIIGVIIFQPNWKEILADENLRAFQLAAYGYSLFITYMVWIGVVFFLYPLSKKYMTYKANNKGKWWLSYL